MSDLNHGIKFIKKCLSFIDSNRDQWCKETKRQAYDYLENKNKLIKALNDRQAIEKMVKPNKYAAYKICDSTELPNICHALDNTKGIKYPQYRISPGDQDRISSLSMINNYGFHARISDQLSVSERWVYSSLIFSLSANIVEKLTQNNFKLTGVLSELSFSSNQRAKDIVSTYKSKSRELGNELYQSVYTGILKYILKQKLVTLVSLCGEQETPIKKSCLRLAQRIKDVTKQKPLKPDDYLKLQSYIDHTTQLIKEPHNPKYQRKVVEDAREALSLKRSWSKSIGLGLVSVWGGAIFAVSLVIGLSSFGAFPLAVLGLKFAGMLLAKITAGIGVTSGLGSSISAGIFCKKTINDNVSSKLENIHKTISRNHQ